MVLEKKKKIPHGKGKKKKKMKKPQDILTHKYINKNVTFFSGHQRSVAFLNIGFSLNCPFEPFSYFSASVSSKQKTQNAKKGDENSQNEHCHVKVGGLLSGRRWPNFTWQDTIYLY